MAVQIIHQAATITASGTQTFTGFAPGALELIVNVKSAPTGTLPTLQYSVQEVDPLDLVTLLSSPVTTSVINAIGDQVLTIPSQSGALKVSWTIGGTVSPTFTNVDAVINSRTATTMGEPGQTAPPNAVQIAGVDSSGNLRALYVDSGGHLVLVGTISLSAAVAQGTPGAASSPWTMQQTQPPSDTSGIGTLAADQATVSIPTTGLSTLSISLKWTAAASMVVSFYRVQTSISTPQLDTVTAESIAPHTTTGEWVATYTVSGSSGSQDFIASVAAYGSYQVVAHPYTSGSVSVAWEGSVQTNAATNATQITDINNDGPVTVLNAGTGVTNSTTNALAVALRTQAGDGGTSTAPLYMTQTGGPVGATGPAGSTYVWTGQGPAGPSTTPWQMQLGNGTVQVGVAAGSAAATAGQGAAVVAFSPNTPLPIGATGVIGQVQTAPIPLIAPVSLFMTSALSGTVTTTNGSTAITFSTNQTLPEGSLLQFSNQPGVTYCLAAAVSSSTSGTLSANYTGTGGSGQTTTNVSSPVLTTSAVSSNVITVPLGARTALIEVIYGAAASSSGGQPTHQVLGGANGTSQLSGPDSTYLGIAGLTAAAGTAAGICIGPLDTRGSKMIALSSEETGSTAHPGYLAATVAFQ